MNSMGLEEDNWESKCILSKPMLIHPPWVCSSGNLCTLHMHNHIDRLVNLGYQFGHMEDPKFVDLNANNHGELQKALSNQI